MPHASMMFTSAVLCALLHSAVGYDYQLKAMLKLHNLDELERQFWAISTPGSASYLKFKTVSELANMVGASDQSIKTASDHLVSLGAHPSTIVVSPLRDSITATVSTDTEIDRSVPKAGSFPNVIDFFIRRDGQQSTAASQAQRKTYEYKSPDTMYNVENIKKAYGIPTSLKASNSTTLQMVWGPGTFGYSKAQLTAFKFAECPLLNMDKIKFDTENHGREGGDNFGEGNLDVRMITSFGLNVETIVSNTNTSASTEEGNGFGQAMLDFVTELPGRSVVPQVLSISLGSLSPYSCDLLCTKVQAAGFSEAECNHFMQQQRQVCMYLTQAQVERINIGYKMLGTRGVSVFGSSGDGGSHWSFEEFDPSTPIGRALNKVGCEYQFPVFPTGSPYMTSVGGEAWGASSSDPIAWSGSGGGFTWQFERQSYQDATVKAYLSQTTGLPPSSSFNQTGRAYPDVSGVAVEGTSESSPMVAGIFSMIMDHRLNNGLPPLGFLGPRLYHVMSESGTAFQDISVGNSKTSCDNGFPAVKGWDPVTGWGRPNWDGLLKAFGSD